MTTPSTAISSGAISRSSGSALGSGWAASGSAFCSVIGGLAGAVGAGVGACTAMCSFSRTMASLWRRSQPARVTRTSKAARVRCMQGITVNHDFYRKLALQVHEEVEED